MALIVVAMATLMLPSIPLLHQKLPEMLTLRLNCRNIMNGQPKPKALTGSLILA